MIKLKHPIDYYSCGDLNYPSKEDYTKYYVYHRGEVIATVASREMLKQYEGMTIEKFFDRDAYHAASNAYAGESMKRANEFKKCLLDYARNQLSDMTEREEEVLLDLYSMAYEDCHSEGYHAVASKFEDFVELFL